MLTLPFKAFHSWRHESADLGAKPAKIDPAREKGIPIIGVADLLEVLER